MAHKSGFVNIIGSPNVGKSTLMNELVGERLSIITSKAQTTRHRILGIVNEDDYQICFSDTPGVLVPSYKLQEGMMQFVDTALKDADLFLLVTDFFEDELNDPEILGRLKKTNAPILVLINKLDLVDQEKMEAKTEAWAEKLPDANVLPISALHKANVELVMDWILARLPEGPAYYDKEALTDKPERFFASEIIREKILQQFKKEIPYSVEVVVEEFKESTDITRIRAIIYVARDSQKGIIIGHQGQALKGVGIDARMDLEKFFGTQIFLDLYVKVNKDWKSDERKLKRFGYLH
ncbi:MAG: GTPase Era [Flavobacteriales bacterium]|nr:GTPase Era [Flavobacteriales bacterium]|tara:strand:+ start:14328 stop:15209 length:882 start_codon:yes stop_codon:yes gene_type:complete